MERTWSLPAAAAVLALENVGLIGALLFLRSGPPAIPVFLLVKFPFCVGFVQRRHGAFMVLTLWETATFAIALINPALDLVPRALVLATSAGALTLMGMSLRLFPEVRLPHQTPDGRDGWGV